MIDTTDLFYRQLGQFRAQIDKGGKQLLKVYDQALTVYQKIDEEDLERYGKMLARIQEHFNVVCRDASRMWLQMSADMTDAAYLDYEPRINLDGKLETPTRPAEVLDFTPKL